MNGEILIVDEHTGRMLAGRRYNEGMHQAIEAKEGVEIQNENQTLATITLQNYFRMYDTLSGMTGTAQTEAAELNSIYKLGVVPIPTNRPMIRKDQADLVYRTEEAKYRRRRRRHRASGMPRGSRCSSAPCRSRRASTSRTSCAAGASRTRSSTPSSTSARPRSSRRPAARAPSPSRPTWPAEAPTSCSAATPSSWPSPTLKQQGLDPVETPEEYEAAWDEALAKAEEAVKAEHDEVTAPRRALRPGHRAPRVAPHRQPAAWSLRPSGRPGRVPLLPVAAATT